MSESDKPCPVCRAGKKEPGSTTFTVDLGIGVVVVRDVPAQVCDLCGADWIEDATAETLERIVEQAREKLYPVGVIARALKNVAYQDEGLIQYKAKVMLRVFDEDVKPMIDGSAGR